MFRLQRCEDRVCPLKVSLRVQSEDHVLGLTGADQMAEGWASAQWSLIPTAP